jgi:PAS domain S-box-containing protein
MNRDLHSPAAASATLSEAAPDNLADLVRRRRRLLEIGPQDEQRLRAVHDALATERDGMIEEFYEFLHRDPALACHLPAGARLEDLKRRHARYFETLTAGEHGEAYVRARMEIGRVHHRAGIRPDVYLGSYRKYVQLALRRLAGRLGRADASYLDAADSFLKIVAFDTQLALDAYIEAAQRELDRAYDELQSVFDNAITGIAYVRDGRMERVNQHMLDMLGCAREELEGQPVEVLFDPAQRAREFVATADRQLARDAGFDEETAVRRRDGTVAIWRIAGRALRRDEPSAGAVWTCEDLTEYRRVERELGASHERFVRVADNIPILIAQVDRSLRYVYANRAYRHWLGDEHAQVVGAALRDVVRPEVLGQLTGYIEAALAGSEVSFERTDTRAANPQTFSVGYLPSRDARGRIDGYYVIAENITPRVEAQRALAESETRYRALFESSADAILVLEDGIIVDHNPSAARLVGANRSELLGRAFLALAARGAAGAGQVNEVGAALETVLSGEPQRLELRLRGAKDEDLYIDARFNRLEVEGVSLVQAILRDVTPRKRAERGLVELTATLERRVAERTAALEAANRELEAFTYGISHDLRAPLRAIDGFGRLLEEDYGASLDAGARDCLKRLRAAGQRLNRMLSDLLRLSRLARAPLARRAVDLSAIAAEIAADLRTLAPREVEFVIADGIVVEGDEGLLRNVLENLLANAWKYTARHARARIEFGRADTARGTAYFVRDDGAGFDMAYADKLFDVFQRLHRQDEFPGEGIGLATVRRIVSRHGGTVWAEGAVEEGATVYFTLWTESEAGD